MKQHIAMVRKDKTSKEGKSVTFSNSEEINFNDNVNNTIKIKIRFKEIMEERQLNDEWEKHEYRRSQLCRDKGNS